MRRHNVNKHRGAKSFNRGTQRTKLVNISPRPMRGGYRM